MTDAETAWVAGLIEGEGSFTTLKGTRSGRVSMGSTDRDVLEKLAAITGVGKVTAIKAQASSLGSKPIYQWVVWRKANVRLLTERILPWLGERRTGQALALIKSLGEFTPQPQGFCVQGHELTPENRTNNGAGGACRLCANARHRRRHAALRGAELCTAP
jgi:hypothetical protein